MAKPRIIIADTDVNYILPLQLKFAEDYFEQIDLEIITDPDYFKALFAVPQHAEILIISEDLYDRSLQRHNIENVFLMTEIYEEEMTGELNVNRIYKYTSIKEIFNEITGKSAEALKIDSDGKKEPQIVLVYSAAGGTGKTTVAMGICSCLTRNYKRVLYLNASHLQSFQRVLKNPSAISSTEIYAKLVNAGESVYSDIKHVIRSEQFYYIPPFKASLISTGLDYSVYEKIAVSAKKSREYDFIVVDTDMEFNNEKANLLNLADKVIIVTKQTAAAVYATNILVSNVNGMTGDKYLYVCNDFVKEAENALISPTMPMKFTVNEYVEHFSHYDQMGCEDFGKNSGIQKVAFLMM